MSGFLIGVVIGVMLLALVVDTMWDRSRAICERDLPRTEKCVQQWVPESAVSK